MANEARLPDAQRSRALLIGVGEFTDDQLPDLPSVRNNLTGLAEVLTSPWGAGLPDTHCTMLTDPADRGMVGDHLMQVADQAQDLLLIYYAGHGLIDARGELHLALSTTRQDLVDWTAVPFNLIRQAIADSAASNRVLILDCCFSGRAIEAMAGPGSVVAGQIEISGSYTLTATSATTPARAPSGAQHTTFTGALHDLLHRGIPGGPELLTLDLIYNGPQSSRKSAAGAVRHAHRRTSGPRPQPGHKRRARERLRGREPGRRRSPARPASQKAAPHPARPGGFPEPAGTDGAEPYWHDEAVLRWAAASSPEPAARVPLEFWPDATAPADYLGVETHEKFVIQRWQTQSGSIAVVWSLPEAGPLDLMTIAPRIKATSTVVAECTRPTGSLLAFPFAHHGADLRLEARRRTSGRACSTRP